MNKYSLLKNLLPGLVPLLIFIAADEIWGTKVGLIIAVIFGLGELIYFLIREKRIEKFVLIDTGLIVIMGSISLISANDIFFLLKPALIEFILCVFLFISAFTPKNLLLGMSKRFMKGVEFNDLQLKQLSHSTKWMFWVVLMHILLIVYSAYFMSKEAWGFISGVLLYLLMGAYFLLEFLRQKYLQSQAEWVPLVDLDGKIIGKATRKHCHSNPALLHPIARMHIFNSSGQIFLQKRLSSAETCPNMWDAAVAGHIKFGEELDTALKREALEEMNLTGFDAQAIGKNVFRTEKESELLFLFMTVYDDKIIPNLTEVQATQYFTIQQLKSMKHQLTPALIDELILIENIAKKIRNK